MLSFGKSGASKIDKLIKDNLKKQIQKDLEQKEKDRQIKKDSKKKRVELEQANDRVRKLNKEKVQRRQMIMLLQSNIAGPNLANTAGPNEKTLDRNLQNILARSEKDEITYEMTKLLQAIDEKPEPQKKNPKAKNKTAELLNQPQLQTQKFEHQKKHENGVQLENMIEPESQMLAQSDLYNQNQESIIARSIGDSQNFANALIGLKGRKKEEKSKERISGFIEPKLKDHRRSHGLDFLDMRKEILSELKQLGHRVKTKYKKQGQEKQLKAQILNSEILDYEKEQNQLLHNKPSATVYIQLRGSKSQRQLFEQVTQPKGNKICIKRPVMNQNQVDSIFSAINKEQHRQDTITGHDGNADSFTGPELKQKKQFSIDISKLVERVNIQQQSQNHTAPLKKEIIRKFMKQKQKLHNQEAEKQKQQEIKKTLKVHANLTKLNNFCKKQLLNTTTAGNVNTIQLTNKIYMPITVVGKSNLKIRHRNIQREGGFPRRSDLDEVTRNDLTITPNRMFFEDSEPSLNVSGTRLSRGGTAAHTRKDLSKSRAVDTTDDLYEDSKIQSMQTLEERPINSLGQHQRQFAGQKRQNKFTTGLAPCFEKSSSAKTLRAQFYKKSQSPPKPADSKKANQSLITTSGVRLPSQEISQINNKKLRNVKGKKRRKSITKGRNMVNYGVTTSKTVTNQNKLSVKIPNVHLKRRDSSLGTLQSQDESFIRRTSTKEKFQKSRITSSVKKRETRTRAALLIQREVRKFLNRLGFYEARQILSPDRQPQINLFIEQKHAQQKSQKGRKKSKSSKSRSCSRSSGGKKQIQKFQKDNQPSKTKTIISPNKPKSGCISKNTSPDQKDKWRKSGNVERVSRNLQKTTIIAEISGLKKCNLLQSPQQLSEEFNDLDKQDRSIDEKAGSDNRLLESGMIGKHQLIESMQILDSSNYASAKSGAGQITRAIQSITDDDQVSENDRLINLNKVQVLPQFNRITFLEGLHQKDDLDEQDSKTKMRDRQKRKKENQQNFTQEKSQDQISVSNLKNLTPGQLQKVEKQAQKGQKFYSPSPDSLASSKKKSSKAPSLKQVRPISQKPFGYKPVESNALISESVSILDRLQGTSAANNFNKNDESNAFLPGINKNLYEKHLPALKESSRDEKNSNFWLLENDQNTQSVQTPCSSKKVINLDNQSHQTMSAALKSASVSENDIKRIQLSVESKRSSQNGILLNDVVSQSSSSLFDRNAFQQFTNNQKNNLNQNSEYQKLIKFREDCLRIREHKEKKHIQKLLKNNQCSPRTYHTKKLQIDRWVNVERMDIERTKVTFQQEWDKTVKMIEETQKSVDQIRSKINISGNLSNVNSINNIAMQSQHTSGQKQKQSSVSGSASKKPSILIEDPPKSYRSSHQEQKVLQIEKSCALSSHRSANYSQVAENLIQYMEKRLGAQHESLVSVKIQEKAESERVLLGNKLSVAQEDEAGSRLRSNSQASSECSQQPSAEFLERLERVKKQELEFQSLHINIAGFDEPDIEGKILTSVDEIVNDFDEFIPGMDVQENDFYEKNGLSSIDKNSEQKEKDPAPLAIDSNETHILQTKQKKQSQGSNNIKIAEMLQKQKEEGKNENLPHYNFEPYLKNEANFLNEPAIISSSSSGTHSKEEPTVSLVQAKIKPFTKENHEERQNFNSNTLLGDAEQREDFADLLTEALFENLIKQCVQLPQPRGKTENTHQQKKEQQEEDQKQEPQNVDVYLVDSQLREKEERKEWIEIRQRHLIENDLIRIDQYINEIVDSLLQFEIDFSSDDSQTIKKDIDNFHVCFLKQLTQPIQKEPIEVLQALQTSEIGSYKHFETTQDVQKHPIIPVDLYLEIEKAREEAMIQRKGPNVNRETQLVWESIHIQNKSFFDAVNESLMKFRPYGLTGEPMPWSNKVRRLQTKVDINSVDTERLFQMVKQEVFRWGQTFCGCLPSPVFAFPSMKNRGQEEFNNELFQEFREKRQTQVLWAETVEQEHHWLNFDYEEAQVKIDLSDMILEHLVDELVEFLSLSGGVAQVQQEVESSIVTHKYGKMKNPPPSSPFNEIDEIKSSKMDPEVDEERNAKEAFKQNFYSNTRSELQ